jgi:hypothetical protein
MPAQPARKVKAMPYTFRTPIFTLAFAGEQQDAVVRIKKANEKGGVKAAVEEAKVIRKETIAARKAGDMTPIVEVEVVNSAGDFYSF